MADWSSRGYDAENFSLFSYQTSSTKEYRSKVRGINYKNTGGKKSTISNPAVFTLRELIHDWNPDDTHEDRWETSRAHPDQPNNIARTAQYREAEVPFIIYNNPELESAVSKMSLSNLLYNFGFMPRMVERSSTNHFMYYSAKVAADSILGWTPPQLDFPLTFGKFLRLAEEAEKQSVYYATSDSRNSSVDAGLHYMTIGAAEGGRTPWITDALPYYSAGRENNFFIVDSGAFHGINCRFGMRGVVAEAHYDGARNFISMVRGRKRYMLLPPSECDKLHLLPRGHPSGRHSSVDWSDTQNVDKNGQLWDAMATEAIISSGDILYIPSFWFHYIISQDASIQCNARSGASPDVDNIIKSCMKRAGEEGLRAVENGSVQPEQKKMNRKNKRKKFNIISEAQF
eukprot:GSChrysophyteH1.ASY1.ANO1.394.1 assembled CDS